MRDNCFKYLLDYLVIEIRKFHHIKSECPKPTSYELTVDLGGMELAWKQNSRHDWILAFMVDIGNLRQLDSSETKISYVLIESEVFIGTSQTQTLPYWRSNTEVNTARTRFTIFLWRRNVRGK